jgi:hypothetical protein
MSKSKQTFRQGDLTRAFKAATAAGLAVKSARILRDGEIVLAFVGDEPDAEPEVEEEEVNPWERIAS